MNKPVVIWGASGHARVVADILRLNGYSISGFLDDVNHEKHGTAFCDSQILGGHEKLAELRREGWLKPSEPVWYNAGIYIFEPSLYEFTARLAKSARGEYELTDAVNGLLEAGHKLAGLEIQGRWVDVRDPQVLAALERPG